MNIAQDVAAVEKFAKSLQGMDPAKVVDTALKFMSSTRSRIEAGEKRIADLETKLGTALDTIDKLSGILGSTTGIDFSAFESEVAAMGKSTAAAGASDKPASADQLVAQVVPDADPAHIAQAITAHDQAVASGATPDAAKAAAVTAATTAGATDVQAQAIAAAIPVANMSTDGAKSVDAAAIADTIPSPAVTAPVVQAAADAHADAVSTGTDPVQAATNAASASAQAAGSPITALDAANVAKSVSAALTGQGAAAPTGKTILADGTQV